MHNFPGQPGLLKITMAWSRLLLILLVCSAVLGACGPNPTASNQIVPTPSSNLKVSSALLGIFVAYETTSGSPDDKKTAALKYARDKHILNNKDEAVFDLEIDPADRQAAIEEKIKSMGGRVTNAADMEGEVHLQVNVPVEVFITYANNSNNFLSDIASFQGVKSVNLIPAFPKQEFRHFPDSPTALQQLAGQTKNEGVKMMGADKWQAAGFKGKGVKIGVIDGGFKYYKKFIGSTLPSNLVVKDIDAASGGSGVLEDDVHGTAVLEIVASLAPEAQLYAVAFNGNPIQLKQSLDYLVGQGVNIVSGSFGYHTYAGDGTSAVSRLIDTYRKKGILFLFSSGNEGDSHYTEFFNPDADGFHQFIPGVTRLLIATGSSSAFDTDLTLNWEQWGLSGKQVTDLDLFLLDRNDNVIESSEDSQSSRNPVEFIQTKLEPKKPYYVRIRQKGGASAPAKPFRLHLFSHDVPLQFSVPQMAIASPADSKSALAVGAIQWEVDRLAYYSSEGPALDGRFKPEIAAPAGVSSLAYAEEGQKAFDGTSASCPEAAGIAAILKGANPNLSTDDLEELLKQSVKDLDPGGPDYANGYGRLDIGQLNPSANIAPTGKAATVPNADMTNLQYPVLVLKYYPTPKVDSPSMPKAGPTPLPTRGTGLEDGATNDSKAGSSIPVNVPNPTPRPTATPSSKITAGVPPVASINFSDSFKDITTGLPNSGPTFYQNGTYHVKAAANQLAWGSYPNNIVSVSDFGAEMTVQGLTTKDALYGLIFWQQDAQNYYLLSVNGTGQYQISRFSGGQYQEIIEWSSPTGWKTNSANVLRLVASQGNLAVFFNDQAAKTGQATGQGAIGFAAGSYGPPAEAVFTNFRLTLSK